MDCLMWKGSDRVLQELLTPCLMLMCRDVSLLTATTVMTLNVLDHLQVIGTRLDRWSAQDNILRNP